MRLFIRILNGQTVEHPMLEENFKEVFPEVDIDNLPPEFAEFIRVPPPNLDRFEVYEGVTYEWSGDKVTDVHHVRPMTDEEKQNVIAQLKSNPPGKNWRWNEQKLAWVPAVGAVPKTGGPWAFNQTTNEYEHMTTPPYPSWRLHESGLFWEAPIPSPPGFHIWDEPTQSWIPG